MKKKADRLGSDPFEKVLPHLSDSRKKKDADINNADDVDKNADNDANNAVIDDKNKNSDDDVNIINDVDEIVNNDVNNNNNNDNDTDNAVNSNISKNVVDDISTDDYAAADSDDAVGVSNDVYSDAAVSSAVSGESAVNIGGVFKIQKKTPKSSHYTRATFYLRPDQLRTINRLHKDSGRDKSELVRMAVDILIKQARVE